MKRRDFLASAGGAAFLPRTALAQSTGKMLRVGVALALPRSAPLWVAFERKLSALGYQEGRNFIFDYVQTLDFEGLDAGYRDIVARKPDIVIAAGAEVTLKAARAAAGTLPIVMIAVDYDPLARGHIASLSHPGGNISGVYLQSTELAGKRLQLMKEAVPQLTAATVLWDPAANENWAALQAAAPRQGVRLTKVDFRERPYDYERVIAEVAPADRQFIVGGSSPFFYEDRAILAEFALRHRTPIMLNNRDGVIAGGLMSYAASLTGMWELAATYVDRIAKGAKPSDLPVEQPVKFEMVLNMKTANALGLTIQPLLLARVDEVIE